MYSYDTKMEQFGRRWYDPATGRWVSEDPSGFGGGQANLYGYVGNDATNAVDPSGLIGLFFDGNQQTDADNTIITQLQKNYTGPKEPVYRYKRLGALSPLELTIGLETARSELALTVRTAVAKAKAAYENGEPIDLFGYSRGAVAAILVAQELDDLHIPVRFMGLLEPSATWSGWPMVAGPAKQFRIPDNVKNVWIGLATGKSSNAFTKVKNFFPEHFQPETGDKTMSQVTSFPTVGHWDSGRASSVGRDLWNAARRAGVPVGGYDPFTPSIPNPHADNPNDDGVWDPPSPPAPRGRGKQWITVIDPYTGDPTLVPAPDPPPPDWQCEG
jgi:RHS repeat-associated protein